MKKKEIIERSQKFIVPYCVTNGKKFRLKDIDPGDTGEASAEDKPLAKELLEAGVELLAELQDRWRWPMRDSPGYHHKLASTATY
jgi:hypothetical protein